MTTTHPYPTAVTDRLTLRSDEHAERRPARRSRRTPPNPVALAIRINKAEREVQHYRSLAEEYESDTELLRQDPSYGPLSSRTARAEGMARQARADEARAQAELNKLLEQEA